VVSPHRHTKAAARSQRPAHLRQRGRPIGEELQSLLARHGIEGAISECQ
jgi:hypothetical protein